MKTNLTKNDVNYEINNLLATKWHCYAGKESEIHGMVLAMSNKRALLGCIYKQNIMVNYNIDQRKIGILATLCNQSKPVTNPKIE